MKKAPDGISSIYGNKAAPVGRAGNGAVNRYGKRKPTQILSRTRTHFRITFGDEVKELVVEKQPTIEERLLDLRAKKKAAHQKRENFKVAEGFLYLISNPAFPGWIKVGQTIDYEARLRSYQTASPFTDYIMEVVRWVPDSFASEQLLLQRLNYEKRGEWVKVDIEEILKVFISV